MVTEEVYIFPASLAQQRLWFLDRLRPGTPSYHVPAAIRLTGPLDVPALERSINTVVERHESLRTTIPTQDGQPVQRIAPPRERSLPVVDVELLPHIEGEAELARLIRQEAHHPFDLKTGPLLRVRLMRFNPHDHLLLLTMHHIICDGWSIGVFMRELATLYEGDRSGQTVPLPPMPLQYADYTIWQRELVQSGSLKPHLDYWREQLRGAPAVLELPTDRPRPPVQTFWGDRQTMTLPATLQRQLQQLSRRADVTLFMTLLAAFQVLLYRSTGQEDIVVGSPVANRTRADLEPLIGFFVNMLVLRTDLSGHPTFRELLEQVRRTTLAAYEHQEVPFDYLVDELQPERDTSHTPLFQVVFILQNTPMPPLELANLRLKLMDLPGGVAKFDLTLEVTERADGLEVVAEYSTDLFDAETVARWLQHYRVLLEGIAAVPDCRIARLPLLTDAEYRQVVYDWNQHAADYPADAYAHELFANHARRAPDALAVVDRTQRLTYHAVDCRANQIAHLLRGMGVGADRMVALCVERSADFIIGLLGVLKAGAAYVPLDPLIPPQRLQTIMADAEISVVLTHQALRRRFEPEPGADAPEHRAVRVICLDTDMPLLEPQPETPPVIHLTPDHLAYVIYTSGSTGTPKGVLLTHRGLTNLVFWYIEQFALTAQDRTTQVAGLGFDATVWELLPALAAGTTVYMPDDETRSMPERLRDWLIAQDITVSFLPTPLAERLLSLEWPASCALRVVQTAGEALKRYPPPGLPFTLYNNYGPSECTVAATSTAVLPTTDAPFPPSIGYPLKNTQVYILDGQMQPVPMGVPGELCIGGVNVGRGYLNRPSQTAAQFVPDPFSGRPGARLYRTGDLVRSRPDGQIDFLGRIDTQVKIRGFRIELGEIEAVLLHHPAVREAVVLAREDTPGERYLVAYVVPGWAEEDGVEHQAPDQGQGAPRPALSTYDLRAFLKKLLPDYMVPGVFVVLDELPLTPNGKVDRKVLPAPEASTRLELGIAYVAPQSELEQAIAAVWQEALNAKQVGVEDSFFDLGGNSLLMARAQSMLVASLQRDVSILDLFKYPTIRSLAQFLEQGAGQRAQQSGESVRDRARKQKEVISRHKQSSKGRK
ncbi:MAG: amino acid adenylation domain-containing protein [Chloroflexaceae bacterium]|nr:amino acid adenylation domain-containing protein [Chloroflexaceae bacterium]